MITVTDKTKTVANGIGARVIRDVATENGTPVEITDDWYAQDKDGNVWYLGEAVRNFENGKFVDREGSFEAGVDGAQAGVVMPADPVARALLSPGVLQGRGGGQGRGDHRRRGAGGGAGRFLRRTF